MPDTEIKTEQNEQQETNDAQVAENQQQATAEQESALESQNDEQHPSVAKAIDDLGIAPARFCENPDSSGFLLL